MPDRLSEQEFTVPSPGLRGTQAEQGVLAIGSSPVDTRHIQKNKKPLFFGAVQVKKSYVSYHLMPVYLEPDLLAPSSSELKARMQGKSC